MLAALANETSAIIQFRLTQYLCCISPEERAAVEVKIFEEVKLGITLKSIAKAQQEVLPVNPNIFQLIVNSTARLEQVQITVNDNTFTLLVKSLQRVQRIVIPPKYKTPIIIINIV